MLSRLTYNARRIRQTLAAFSNGGQVLRAIVGKAPELTFETPRGVRITIPNVPGARVPVYEVLAEDAYRIGWFTADLEQDFGALDIGGHVGCFSVALAGERRDAKVWAYEASPATVEYTRRNIDQNDLGDRVSVDNIAVSSHAGSLTLAEDSLGSGLNGITAPGATTTVEIPAVTFTDAVERADRTIRLVKIDTEGAEYDIVLGSDPDTWSSVERVVLEYHDVPGHDWAELGSFFDRAGFTEVHREDVHARLGTVWLSRRPLSAPV